MPRPSGTVTLLFTDIVGSTALWEAEPAAMATALERHDHLLRAVIEAEGGYVFKTVGDAFCAAFGEARAAMRAAVAAQRTLLAEPWPTAAPIKVRMGLHTGACEERDGDYFGPAVNRAARLQSTAHGGQIVVSRATAELLADVPRSLLALRDLGEHRLKDLGRPEAVYQVEAEGLPGEFPPLRSLDHPDIANNLPAQLSSFVGRAAELARLRSMLEGSRLVTLTGPGGAGKTRLALQVAAEEADQFADGVWFVDLSNVTNPELVAAAVASALNVREEPNRPVADSLVDALDERDLLIVIDNCEHVIDACAKLVDRLLRSCGRLIVVATSREPLAIDGEQVLRVPLLSLPDPSDAVVPAAALQSEAVALFCERAGVHQPAFTLDESTVAPVVSLCRRLDGIPLAIELAAARLRSMSITEIDSRLDNHLRLLTGGSRTSVPRQQTLRGLIGWSHDLLSEPERTVLRRLSVFSGGWSLGAAESVCQGGGVDAFDVWDLLGTLVDKSLVQTETRGAATRYWLLETIRQFAAEKLAEAGEEEAIDVGRRHADHFLAFAEEAAPNLLGADQSTWMARLEEEHDNLVAALTRLLGRPQTAESGLRLAVALRWFWFNSSHFHEATELTEQALSVLDADQSLRVRTEFLLTVCHLGRFAVQGAAAEARVAEMLDAAETLGDPALLADALTQKAWIHFNRGEYGGMLDAVDRAIASARQADDLHVLGEALRTSMFYIDVVEDPGAELVSRALADGEEALSCFRRVGDIRSSAATRNDLAMTEISVGNLTAARAHLHAASEAYRQVSDQRGLNAVALGLIEDNLVKVCLLEGDVRAAFQALARGAQQTSSGVLLPYQLLSAALCSHAAGNAAAAARGLGAADGVMSMQGDVWQPFEGRLRSRAHDELRGALGDAEFEVAYGSGRLLSRADAATFLREVAFGEPEERPSGA